MPERNDQGIFQNEAGLTEAEAGSYLTYLFRDYTERPAEPWQLQAALSVLKTRAGSHISRDSCFAPSLPRLDCRSRDRPQPFADVAADSELARTLKPWIDRQWIAASLQLRFEPDRACRFPSSSNLRFMSCFRRS